MAEIAQFWVVGKAGELNNLSHRFYTLEDAKAEALRLATKDPRNIYLVLGLDGYAEGEYIINTRYTTQEENIVLPLNENSIVGVTFTDRDGNFVNLENCQIQLIVLPTSESPVSEAIFNATVEGTSTLHEVCYEFDTSITQNPLNAWYKINITEDGVSTLYQQGAFIIR